MLNACVDSGVITLFSVKQMLKCHFQAFITMILKGIDSSIDFIAQFKLIQCSRLRPEFPCPF